MTAAAGPPLVVNGLRAGYGPVQVVNDVSFTVQPGETVALVGRNGVGKTTSLSAVAGLRYGPSGGTVRLGDVDLSRSTPNEVVAAGVKLVPEGRRVFRSMTVHENLRLGAFTHRRGRRAEIAEDFDRVWELFSALRGYAGKLVGELSGGQQQMVAVGQALMSRPRFLLLDEPSSGLAPALVDEIYDRFDELVAQGLGILIVDQSIERVLERSQRFYVMEGGAVALEGASDPSAIGRINAIVLASRDPATA